MMASRLRFPGVKGRGMVLDGHGGSHFTRGADKPWNS